MRSPEERIQLRNISRREILEYLERLEFRQTKPEEPFRRGQIEIRLSETCKTKLCSIRIDETDIEFWGPKPEVQELVRQFRTHFMRAGG